VDAGAGTVRRSGGSTPGLAELLIRQREHVDRADQRSPLTSGVRAGHSSVSFTQDTYMHVIPGMDEHGARVAEMAILGPWRPLLTAL
jgi:hypothetical protein